MGGYGMKTGGWEAGRDGPGLAASRQQAKPPGYVLFKTQKSEVREN